MQQGGEGEEGEGGEEAMFLTTKDLSCVGEVSEDQQACIRSHIHAAHLRMYVPPTAHVQIVEKAVERGVERALRRAVSKACQPRI